MSKATTLLATLALVLGGAYVFREPLKPYAATILPDGVLKSVGLAEGEKNAADGAKGGESGGGGRRRGGGGGGGGISPVTAAVATLSDMPVVLRAPGTVEPMATVAIRPRVDGQIVEVLFKEGDLVPEGEVLFRLDDRLVRAQIKQVEATIAKDQASLRDAESILDRKESLLQKKYASEATTETARQQVEVLKASIEAGRALLDAQRTQLDYLTIKAPITGRTGSANGKLGAFVRSADANALVTINQSKPIAVTFALPQGNLDSLRAALLTKASAAIIVPLTKPITANGQLMFVDNQVDKQTGTVTAKVQVENADELLWPGLAVGVELTVDVKRGLVAVPASSVLPSQTGLIAWVIDGENRVAIRNVSVERTIGQTTYLTGGLKEGERVVTDGQLRLAPGSQVAVRDLRGGESAPASTQVKGGKKGGEAAKKAGEATGDKAGNKGGEPTSEKAGSGRS